VIQFFCFSCHSWRARLSSCSSQALFTWPQQGQREHWAARWSPYQLKNKCCYLVGSFTTPDLKNDSEIAYYCLCSTTHPWDTNSQDVLRDLQQEPQPIWHVPLVHGTECIMHMSLALYCVAVRRGAVMSNLYAKLKVFNNDCLWCILGMPWSAYTTTSNNWSAHILYYVLNLTREY
jgi:hypothetical protein